MKVIALSEIRTQNDQYIEQPCIINPEHMVSAHRGILRRSGIAIVGKGEEHERELTSVAMLGSQPIFVNESVEEIANLITK